jgi:anhydro-N-acetylmuramic acid kinase
VSEAELYIGLISGTSRDGVDAALVQIGHNGTTLLATVCRPYPRELRSRLERLLKSGRRPRDADMRELDVAIAGHFAESALNLLDRAACKADAVRAIGSHGQTVWHAPEAPRPESIQLGSPAVIAEHTGICTVGDFRRADIEAGGQGAPLAPLLHRALFRPETGRRIVLNLGGIANISVVDASGEVTGFDTGPANCLLDAWIREHQGRAFDADGAWAAGGQTDHGLLEALLQDPWFAKAPPKSTGIEYFNLAWLARHLADRSIAPRDVQATLAELTAVSIAEAVRPLNASDLLLCGGGCHNGFLRGRLEHHLPGLQVRTTADFGVEPDWVEAVLFAWLAHERLAGNPQDTRAITGARRPVLLGSIAWPAGVE